MRQTGTTLRDLIGGRWQSPADLLKDLTIAAMLWVTLIIIAVSWRMFGGDGVLPEFVVAMMPRNRMEAVVWAFLSISAGVAEEIMFRGYLQRQFEALIRNRWVALLLQAVLFGITHGYQGVQAMMRITLLGIAFGVAAVTRRSLRPGIIAHSWTDLSAGVFGV